MSNACSVAFSHDGHRIVSALDDKTNRIWNATGEAEVQLTVHGIDAPVLRHILPR